jgi:hypothetical protein
MVKTVYPYKEDINKIRHYSDNPDMDLLQVETGKVYDGSGAVDVFPCEYNYNETPKIQEENVDFLN